MAAKTKKAKSKVNSNNAKLKTAEKKIERLELLSQAQDIEHLTTQLNALKIKMQSLQTEATMVGKETAELQKDGKDRADKFTLVLAAFKKKYNVPDDKEVNLRTGELVDPPPQQGVPGKQPPRVPTDHPELEKPKS